MDSITLGILLGESYYNWHLYTCGLFCLASGPPTIIAAHTLFLTREAHKGVMFLIGVACVT
jgi:hypothetical protein